MGRNAGFTLLELMITLVILAILAMVAYPSYLSFIQRGNRSAAQQYLMDIANREEQYFLDVHQYTTTLGSGGLNLSTPDDVSGKYTVTVTAANSATPPTFTATATPVAGSSMAGTQTLTLNSTGVKTPAEVW